MLDRACTDLGTKPPRERDALRQTARRQLPVVSTSADRIEPPVLGEPLLRAGDRLMQRVDSLVVRLVGADMNPLAQTGAIANTTFIIACVTGVLLLFWYKTSVHEAFGSVTQMMAAPYTAGLVRSLHRYSSDACMLFVLLHAVKLFLQRRFGGARWLMWITGIFLVSTLWFVGWLGYWLVWDERGQAVAVGTAQLLDALPIFADPLSRSFLTDQSVNSLLFFVVFFLHMLIPLLMGIALWLHITRLSRSNFLTGRAMTAWVLASLVVLSLLAPADVAGPATMSRLPGNFAFDGWYLLPVLFTERLGAGALWALLLVSGIVLYSLPWLLVRKRARIAEVSVARCNGCARCYEDCPYEAIRMLPRDDAQSSERYARVDANNCLGCGVCAGSCDSAAIGLSWFDTSAQRQHINELTKAEPKPLAFVCAESVFPELDVDPTTSQSKKLVGYYVQGVPCAGLLHPLSVERALRRGAPNVLIVSCGEGDCRYREGAKWTELRMSAAREPTLRTDKVDASRVRVVHLFRHELEKLAAVAHDAARPPRRRSALVVRGVAASALVVLISASTYAVSELGHKGAEPQDAELIISFKHPGKLAQVCRDLSEQEKKKLPVHMRPPKVCTRERADVRLRVAIDGREVVEKAYEPRGIWNDGNSIAIERMSVSAGRHRVSVRIGDTRDPRAFPHYSEKEIQFAAGTRAVVLFDKLVGFQWFESKQQEDSASPVRSGEKEAT